MITMSSATKPTTDEQRPVFVLESRPEPNVVDPVRALKALLKSALRRHGLRCTSACEEKERP